MTLLMLSLFAFAFPLYALYDTTHAFWAAFLFGLDMFIAIFLLVVPYIVNFLDRNKPGRQPWEHHLD